MGIGLLWASPHWLSGVSKYYIIIVYCLTQQKCISILILACEENICEGSLKFEMAMEESMEESDEGKYIYIYIIIIYTIHT